MTTLNSTLLQYTALHQPKPVRLLRIVHRPYPSNRLQRETHWTQRLNTLFAKQRY